MPVSTIGPTMWRVSPQGVTRRDARPSARGPWEPVTRAELRALPVDSAEWQWLREHGVKRPSPSGPSGGDDRLGTRMTLRLDAETTVALDALARRWGLVRSQVIARALALAADDVHDATCPFSLGMGYCACLPGHRAAGRT